MKRMLLILFFAPLFAGAQCPNWLTNSTDEALKLLPVVQQFVGFEMKREGDPFSVERIEYRDSLELCFFRVSAKKEVRYEGINKIEGPARVYAISFSGPAEAIAKMFDSFKEQFKSCPGYKSAGQYILVGKTRIVWTDGKKTGVPLKYIQIDQL